MLSSNYRNSLKRRNFGRSPGMTSVPFIMGLIVEKALLKALFLSLAFPSKKF